ncbi:MAG: hypothetical protein A2W26_02485 [Acidobacteria bacterium RBG_16_64_8]|nr:MAG: hypothetical protein A2W26_02485 [Acidobacteria bacterium RBG_16_64_8]
MNKNLICAVVLLSTALFSTLAGAQVQPIPVVQSRDQWTAFSNAVADGFGAAFDSTNYASVTLIVQNANCTTNVASVLVYTGSALPFTGGAGESIVGILFLVADSTQTYEFSRLMKYAVPYVNVAGGGCTVSATLVGNPFATAQYVQGLDSNGTRFTSRPVSVGGMCPSGICTVDESRTIRVDSAGRQYIVGAEANGAVVAADAYPVKIAGSDGTTVRTVLTDAAGRLITAGYAGYGQTFSPGVPTRCNMAASTSCPLTAFAAAGSCVQLFCSVDSFFRVGVGAQVAVATDTSISAKTIFKFCMTSAQESAAFYSTSAGYCELSVVPTVP